VFLPPWIFLFFDKKNKKQQTVGEKNRLHSSSDFKMVMKSRAINRKGMWQARGGKEIYRWLCWNNLKERYHLENIEVDGKIILKCILKKQD
jgi:hypothetical protein